MAHFIGYVQGNRGEASRLGSKDSGIKAQAQGWEMGGVVRLWHYKPYDRDNLTLDYNTGSNGGGSGASILHVVREKGEIVSAEMNMNAVAEIMGYKLGDRVSFKTPALFGNGTIKEILGNVAMVQIDQPGQAVMQGADPDHLIRVPFDRVSMWHYKEPDGN